MTALRTLGASLAAFSLLSLLSGAIALAFGETSLAGRFLLHTGVGVALSGGLLLTLSGRAAPKSTLRGLASVTLTWAILPLIVGASLADLTGTSWTTGVFEASSGLTTTGSTAFRSVDDLPRAIVFHRGLMHWFGGYLTLLTILLVLAPLGVGGLAAPAVVRSTGRRGTMQGNRPAETVRTMLLAYVAATSVTWLAFMMARVETFDAAALAMTAVSSGGFLPFDADLRERVGGVGLVIFGVALLLAATSVFWHRMILRWQVPRLQEHRESYAVLAVTLVLMLVLFSSIERYSSGAPGERLALTAESFFNAASLVSTSGIESRSGVLTLVTMPIALFVMLVGGSAYSTSGGLKLYRLGAMLVQASQELHRLVYPNAVLPSRFGSQRFDIDLLKAIWSFLLVSIVTIALSSSVMALFLPHFEAALMAALASFTGAGPIYEAGWQTPGEPPWPTWAEMPDPAKWTAIVTMVLGRIEILAVLALVSLQYWRARA